MAEIQYFIDNQNCLWIPNNAEEISEEEVPEAEASAEEPAEETAEETAEEQAAEEMSEQAEKPTEKPIPRTTPLRKSIASLLFQFLTYLRYASRCIYSILCAICSKR